MIEPTTIVKDQILLEPIYHRIPKLSDLAMTQTLNTFVVCRVCRGQRIVAIKSDTLKTFTYKKCLFCQGSGRMSNRESDYDK